MDIATIIGFIAAFGLVLMGMGSDAMLFLNIPSVLIVVGGTIGATLIQYPLEDVLGAIGVAKNTLFVKKIDFQGVISMMVDFANKARREGILVLENAVADIGDDFIRKGVMLAVDGMEPPIIEKVLETEVDNIEDRHTKGAELFAAMAALAPAFGLIGTLIGLVLMLQTMDDPSTIGPAMAVALLTTFYGAIMANVIFTPISGKLKVRNKEEILYMNLILEGILSIAAGDNPRIVEQKLNAYLKPHLRKSSFD